MKSFLITVLFFFPAVLEAQSISSIPVNQVALQLDSLFNYGIENSLMPGAMVSLVSADTTLFQETYGYSDVKKETGVTSSTLMQLGSIGKTITAIASLQQVEKGNLSLNNDINDYLNAWGIENSHATPLTLFHLLTHSSGLNDRIIGYVEKNNDSVQDLSFYLEEHMPGLFQEPGKNINYSNFGYGLAGYLVEEASGQDFQTYVNENIFRPAGMNASSFYLPDNYEKNSNYANGYRIRREFEEVDSHPRSLIPAGSLVSTLDDMSSLLKILLKREKLLSSDSFEKMYNQQFTNHSSLAGMTFGFEELFINNHKVFIKGGQVPGFLSFIMIMPESGLGLFVSINTETDNFMTYFMKEFSNRFFPSEITDYDFKDVNLSSLEGSYRNLRAGHDSIEDLFSLMMDHRKVQILDGNTLGIVKNNRFVKYKPVNDSVFVNTSNPNDIIVFSGLNDDFPHLYTTADANGLGLPSSFRKIHWFFAPDTINEVYPFLLLPATLYILFLILWPVSILIRFLKKNNRSEKALPLYIHLTGLAFSILVLIDITGFFIPLIDSIRNGQILFGFPEPLLAFKYVHWLMSIVLLFIIAFALRILINRKGFLLARIAFIMFSLSASLYIYLIAKWHFFNVLA